MEVQKGITHLTSKVTRCPIGYLCLIKTKSNTSMRGESEGKHYGQLENRFWRGRNATEHFNTQKAALYLKRELQRQGLL